MKLLKKAGANPRCQVAAAADDDDAEEGVLK
jgi:hypothetical protein